MPESEEPETELTRGEFEKTVKHLLKNGKVTSKDNIPIEVWKNSEVTKDTFLWKKEEVPPNLVVCTFLILYNKKRGGVNKTARNT